MPQSSNGTGHLGDDGYLDIVPVASKYPNRDPSWTVDAWLEEFNLTENSMEVNYDFRQSLYAILGFEATSSLTTDPESVVPKVWWVSIGRILYYTSRKTFLKKWILKISRPIIVGVLSCTNDDLSKSSEVFIKLLIDFKD